VSSSLPNYFCSGERVDTLLLTQFIRLPIGRASAEFRRLSCSQYIEVTGDWAFLEQAVPFHPRDSPNLPPGAKVTVGIIVSPSLQLGFVDGR
jgi:hypothetical protein